jgi:hypothetical protein
MNEGQAFSLVFWGSTYIWAVGRAVDGSSNEQAFHHLKLNREVIDSGPFYLEVPSTATGKHILLHSDK